MAQITLKIQVNENAGTSLNFDTASEINNVSSLLSKETTQNDGVNGISFATGSISLASGFLGNGGKFQSEKNKYNGYMFGATDSDGKFSLKLTLEGDNLDKIVIYFDKNANQFATEALVDNERTIYSDDPVWAIDLGEELTTHTIEFIKWNRPNYNACFTMLQVMLEYFELNKNWITNLSSLSQSTTNAENIEYGILASTGSADVLDNEGYIADLISDGLINPSSIPVQIFVNGNLIQKHITTSSTYDTDGRTLSINFSNEIENFSKLKYKGYNYPDESKTAYEMLYDVLNSYYDETLSVEKFDNMLSENIVYGEYNYYGPISNYLKNITIEYPFIESNKTYSEVINEFCTMSQLQAFIANNGELNFVSARPIVPHFSNGIDYIFMPPDSVSTNFQEDLILKNKYDGVELEVSNVIDEIDYDTVVYPADIELLSVTDSEMTKETKTNQNIVERSQFISNATFKYEIASYIKSDYYYYDGEITIPKSSVDNLSQITSVNESLLRNNNFAYSVHYNKYIANATADSVWDRGDNKISVSNIKYGNPTLDSEITINGVVNDDSSYKTTLPDNTSTTSTTSTKSNDPIVTFTHDDNNYYLSYKVCVKKKLVKIGGNGRWTAASTSSIDIPLSGKYEEYIPKKLSFSIYGNKRTISFQTNQFKRNLSNTPTNKASVGCGNFIQNKTELNGNKMYSIIANNILSDYNNGIKTAKTTINGISLYDQNGNLAKDWNKGEIINNGDILGFSNKRNKDGSIIYWKTTGRNFLYDGEPLTEIDIMECKPVELYTDSGQFWDMNYSTFQKSLRELSNQKAIVVSNDYISLSAGENVSYLEGFLAIPKTVTSLTGDFSSAIGFTGMKFEIPNEISIRVPSTIFYLDVDIDKWAEKSFNSSILRGNTYFSKNGQVINNLEINSEYIGDYAFCNYAGTNVTLGENISSIGMYSFKDSKITSIIIPNSVKTISREAFNNCYNLSSLKLGNSITELGYGSFMYCSSLTEITIPASVTYINRMSFYGCSSLTKITFENPKGWKSTQTGASIDLSNPANNVTLLTQTYAEQNIAIF